MPRGQLSTGVRIDMAILVIFVGNETCRFVLGSSCFCLSRVEPAAQQVLQALTTAFFAVVGSGSYHGLKTAPMKLVVTGAIPCFARRSGTSESPG